MLLLAHSGLKTALAAVSAVASILYVLEFLARFTILRWRKRPPNQGARFFTRRRFVVLAGAGVPIASFFVSRNFALAMVALVLAAVFANEYITWRADRDTPLASRLMTDAEVTEAKYSAHQAAVGKSGFSAAEIAALEQRRIEGEIRERKRRVVDDQLFLAKQDIRSQTWPIGQANNIELARLVSQWIKATEKIVTDALGQSEGTFFALDVGDPGLVVGAPGANEFDVAKAIQERHLARLDRHIIRLQTIRDRL